MTDWTISNCGPADLGEIADLVNAAYRGQGGAAGWTSEVGMVDGQRTTSAALKADLTTSTGASILALRDAKELLACVRLELTKGARGGPVCCIGMLACVQARRSAGWGAPCCGMRRPKAAPQARRPRG